MNFFKKIFKKEWQEVDSIYKGKKNQKDKNISTLSSKKKNVKIVFYEPKSTLDIRNIAEDIIDGKTASINFHKFDNMEIEKYLQFLGGVIFAINGGFFKKNKFEYFFSASKNIIKNMEEK